MPRKQAPKTSKELLLALSSGLRNAARSPDIHRYEPHNKQLTFHSSKSRGRLFLGGNRAGKSLAGTAESVYYLRGIHPYKALPWQPPLRLRCVTVDIVQGLEKIVLPLFKQHLPPSDLVNGSWEDSWDKQLRTLTLDNGSYVEFLTYEQDLEKFAGTSRHAIYFDEECPYHIFTECMMRLIDTDGHWWMCETPTEGLTWTFENLYSKADIDSNIEVFETDMDDNPYLDEEAKKAALAGLTEEEKVARKKGQYIPTGGFIYVNYFNAASLIEYSQPPIDWLWICGMDHGVTNPTAFIWAAVNKEGQVLVFDEYYEGNRTIKDHALAIHEKNKEHVRPPDYYVGDPAIRHREPILGTTIQLEYMDYGVPIMPGNNEVQAGIERVRRYMVGTNGIPRLYITRNCVNLLWELRRYRWSVWKDKKAQFEKNKKEEPQKKDDHLLDALRYLIASRPEMDTGKEVPKLDPSLFESSRASEPDLPFVDRELTMVTSRSVEDPHMGDEY